MKLYQRLQIEERLLNTCLKEQSVDRRMVRRFGCFILSFAKV